MNIDEANRRATAAVLESRPVLVGTAPAADVIAGLHKHLILHAGPPITWARMSGPLRGAVIGGVLYEGLARDDREAQALVERGEVQFAPCHHHHAVGPMAGVTTASMPVYIVENRAFGNRAYSTLNEGYGKVLRYGAYSDDVLQRLRWLRDVCAPLLGKALERAGGLDMKNLIAQQIQMGDEGHNRNKAGSALMARLLAPHLARTSTRSDDLAAVLTYLADNDLAVLNPVMASCKAMMDAAHGIAGSTVVTCMARNGTDFGIRVSGLGDACGRVRHGRRPGDREVRGGNAHTRCGVHSGDVRDYRDGEPRVRHPATRLPRDPDRDRYSSGGQNRHHSPREHRHCAPQGGYRPGRRGLGATAAGLF